MSANLWAAGLVAVAATAGVGRAQGSRFLLMEGTGEYGWSIGRPSKIDGEAEGRVLALAGVNGQLNGMANISQFEQFSKAEVTKTLTNKFEKVGELMRNTTTFSHEDKREDAFRANQRGLVVTVREKGFKPGTFTHSSDYNKWTGVRKSKASGILLYTFKVYAPEGYDPNGGAGNGGDQKKAIKYTIKNGTGRTVRFTMQPSGKSYALAAGDTFTGTSYEVNGKAPTVTLSDSGRVVRLTAGNHKLWWKSNENRAALDLNVN